MNLVEVTNKKLQQAFLDVPKQLYRHDKNWVCPLDVEIAGIFDPKRNKKFRNGEAIRWVLYDDASNQPIGRIAAFYDSNLIHHFKVPTGACGFFECINNQQAANLLFDSARNWLTARGMQAMQGPVNFGENYNHWGLLVMGFKRQCYAMPYNFPYYQTLFETYGFKNYFEQISYEKDVHSGWPERMLKFAQYVSSRPDYTFEHLTWERLDEFVDNFVEIYNAIWSTFHDNYMPLEANDVRQMLLESKPILDPTLMWFAFDKGKIAGFLGVMPDLNQVLVKLGNGKLNLLNKLKFLYYKKRAITCVRVFVGGVSPDQQNSGIVGALFNQLLQTLQKQKQIQQLELSWVGDYNKKMRGTYSAIGSEHAKTHVTYLKLFDESLPFERFTNEFEGKLY